ncbi:MAG: response regulator [candidate division Zixibacteria bacterium]
MSEGKILILDDEPRMVDSLKTLLAMEGYQVTGENSAEAALRNLDRTDYDLMITDIKMPKLDGIEVMRRARERDPNLCVVLITGYASIDTAKDAVEEGAFGYLTKPLEIDELKLVVARGLEKRRSELEKFQLLAALKVANETLQVKLAQLDALASAGNLLATTIDLKEALTSILSLGIDVIGAKLGSVMILDEAREELYIGASCGLEEFVVQNTRMKLGSSISGHVAKTRRPLIVEDIEKDANFSRINREKYESKSLISAPLIYKDTLFGVINLNNKQNGRPFTADDLRLLSALAMPAAVAIDRANLIADKTETINSLTVLHSLAERVSMMDDPAQIGQTTFNGLKKLFDLDSIFWFDYLEHSNELILEFYHGSLSDLPIPRELKNIRFQNDMVTIGNSIDTILLQKKLNSEVGGLVELSGKSMGVVSLPIFLRRALTGIAVLVFPEDYLFTESLKELAVLALTQTAAIYQRQKAVLNSTQLMTMGRLLGEIGHDLKKPLTNLKGAIQIYQQKIKNKLAGEFFPEAEKEVNRLSELVKEIAEFSKPNKYQKRKIQINDLLEKSLDLISFNIKDKEIKIVKNYLQESPSVMANEHEMLQLFINIMQNSVDSMNIGGTLTLDVQKLAEDDVRWLRIRIEDTGAGVPEDELARIFARYYTTKQGGTGLGLAIAERIILVHNGRISVTSKVGVGTTFMIDLRI